MKTAIVLAGRHDITDKMYEPIVNEFRDQGWEKVAFFDPNWDVRNVQKLVSDFVQEVSGDVQPLTLLGFSLGAMIALIASSKLDVENLILCSPSGYFLEYAKILPDDDRKWAEEELVGFENISAVSTVRNARVARGFLLAGENELKEWPDFMQWIDDLKHQTKWQYIQVPNTGHEIEATKYQAAVRSIIHELAASEVSTTTTL